MARFEYDVSQLDDNIVTRIGKIYDVSGNSAFDEILKKAGERLAEYFRGALFGLGLKDSGQLIDSIKPTEISISGNNEKSIDVSPQGARKERGVRNAMVGFVHEYGTSKLTATHWMSNTVDDVGDEIAGMIADEVSKIIDNELGG